MGVRHEVARVFIKDNLVFCHRHPTGMCVGGNSGVRSFRDNVTLVRMGRLPICKETLRLPALRRSGARVGGYG